MTLIINRRRSRIAIAVGLLLLIFGVGATLVATAEFIDSLSPGDGRARDQTPATNELPPLPRLKEPVDDASVLQETYTFVARHPEVAQYMPCFCACGRDKTHKSLEDCFIKSRGPTAPEIVWNPHGGQCMICVTVAAEARRLLLDGRTVSDIRAEIERTIAPKFKYHTDTPMPAMPAK
jgi:hypothetical protein